jgi:DNA-directed DNA polymerase III PolC
MPVSLHTHSWYSLLEGVSSPEALLRRAAALGYEALALTDTNNLYGAVAFAELARTLGVRPLLGACLRQERSRCVALIAERSGYRSLCRILSRLHLPARHFDGPGSEPARLADLIAADADGLHVLVDDVVLAERLREPLGPRLWLEVVRPPRSARHERELLEFGRRLGLAPVASTAAHFAAPADYPTFRLATAVRQLTLLECLPARFSITPEHHFVAPDTLRQRFADLPEAVRNTDLLAEQLRSDVLPREVILPQPRLPRDVEAAHYLGRLCERGLRRRSLGDSLAARQRLREELAVIEAGNLAGYFLVVRDIARHARRQRHSMALRGSAGNSLVCFLLEITDVDPLRFDLPMERFLHPGRTDLPDIDLDFDWKVRDDVLAHVFRRWGPRHTAMISTHQFLQPRSAFREAAKAHGLSNDQVSRLLESFLDRLEDLLGGPDATQSVGDSAPTRSVGTRIPPGFPLERERWPRILQDARRLLGRPQHLSIHPGGVVITPRPVEDYVPLQLAPKGIIITQFEKDAVEHIGLVKIDLLGNRALGTVDEATRITGCGLRIADSLDAIRNPQSAIRNPHDPATLALLRRGDTLGVNQLESPAMRHLLIQMQPRGLMDVVQALALIRPGVGSAGMKEFFVRRRRGVDAIRRGYPSLDALLTETEGLMIYEDDALRVIHLLTGLSIPDADRFRKRVTKHRTEEEARVLGEEFRQLCLRSGVPEAVALEQWPYLARFNYYTFCKSHAVSYGLIAWTAAYLKAHHSQVFWTAALNNNQGMYPRRVYVEAIKRAGIDLRLPCVNRSEGPFTVEGPAIRTGLDAVATLDEQLRATLLADRRRNGPYRDLADFRRRVQPGPEALAVLIRCGALDFTGQTRPVLFLEADLQDNTQGSGVRGQESGVRSQESGGRDQKNGWLFPDSWSLTADSWGWRPADYEVRRRILDEWQTLGFVVGPPAFALFRAGLPSGLVGSRVLPDHVGRTVRVAGLVAAARYTTTVDGRAMQFITLEDEEGLIEVTLFPGNCLPVPYLTLGPYLATGSVERQFDVVTVTAHDFRRWSPPG